ncbi:MAG: PIN domain-containing protein [Chloroflexota bacterium]
MSLDFKLRIGGMIFFAILLGWFGSALTPFISHSENFNVVVFGLLGALVGLILTPRIFLPPARQLRKAVTQVPIHGLLSIAVGLVVGLIAGALAAIPLSQLPGPFGQYLPVIVTGLLAYLGMSIMIVRQADVAKVTKSLAGIKSHPDKSSASRGVLIDTSVIIDGRVVDIARTGFIQGPLMVPTFVLNELQYVADSAEKMRRQRGRRGLELLQRLQNDPTVPLQITDMDVEGTQNVDDKLVLLARRIGVPILTNDYNLNRVADIQGVTVLNINELANAVRAVYLPGEELRVRIIQQGKERGQGVGYLDDGTMVVVDDGEQYLDADVDTVVTKVLQTAAGRMIFARMV